MPAIWTRPWPAIAAVPGPCPAARHASCHVRGATTATITCPNWWPVGERWPDIRPERQIAEDTGMSPPPAWPRAGHSPSGRWSFRKQRTVKPLIVPARYNYLYISSRPALRPAATPRSSGRRPHPLPAMVRTSRRPATPHPPRRASRSRRIVVALPPGRVDVLLISVPARGTLVMEPLLRGPTTTRTPQPRPHPSQGSQTTPDTSGRSTPSSAAPLDQPPRSSDHPGSLSDRGTRCLPHGLAACQRGRWSS